MKTLLSALLWAGVGGLDVNGADSIVFPKGTNLTSLTVINENQLGSRAQRVMIATLQGIVARHSGSQIYITGGAPGYGIWQNHLKEFYGIPFFTTSNPWSLVTQFKDSVSGYILYDAAGNSNSLNAATSLCGPFNAIAVDASIEANLRSYGMTNRLLFVQRPASGCLCRRDQWHRLFLSEPVSARRLGGARAEAE